MFREIFESMKFAGSQLLRDWILTLTMIAAFALLLASIWFFANSGVGNAAKMVGGLLILIFAFVIFGFLQAIAASFAGEPKTLGVLLKTNAKLAWKILILSIPLIALAWLITYLAQKTEIAIVPTMDDGASGAVAYIDESRSNTSWFSDWRILLVGTVRAFLLYVMVPVIAIQLWISTSQVGILATLKGLLGLLRTSFRARSLITYLLGAITFGVIPYFLITTRIPTFGAVADLLLFGTRLLIAALFILFGWTITVGAIKRLNSPPVEEISPPSIEPSPTISNA